MENKFREFWLDIEKGKTYFSRVNGCTHTIEIAAVEQLKAELRTSDLNRQSLWADSLKLVDENDALKSKLKIAKETLVLLESFGYITQFKYIKQALAEIGGEI